MTNGEQQRVPTIPIAQGENTMRKRKTMAALSSSAEQVALHIDDRMLPGEWERVLELGLPPLRQRRHWSQNDLARRSGLSRRTIWQLEQPAANKPRPSPQTLISLARSFGYVHLSDLWSGLQGAIFVDPGTPLIVGERVRRMVLAFMDCTPQEQQLVESTILAWSARHQAEALGQTLNLDILSNRC
jgi:transcriptional regulator with XRE-family HTH domain